MFLTLYVCTSSWFLFQKKSSFQTVFDFFLQKSLSKKTEEIIFFCTCLEMEAHFIKAKLLFVIQSLENFVIQVSNSDFSQDFVTVGDPYLRRIYRMRLKIMFISVYIFVASF